MIMLARPRLVVFDLDGVLVDDARQSRIEALAQAAGTTPACLVEALFSSGLEARNERGELGLEDWLDAVRRRHGLDLPPDVFLAAYRQGLRLRPEVLGLVQAIATQTTLALFTNGGQWLGRQLPKFLPALRPQFGTRMLTSGQLGATKPDPQSFCLCLATLGYSASSAVLIDDAPEHVAGARSAGLDAIHYASPTQLGAELQLRGFDLEPVHAP